MKALFDEVKKNEPKSIRRKKRQHDKTMKPNTLNRRNKNNIIHCVPIMCAHFTPIICCECFVLFFRFFFFLCLHRAVFMASKRTKNDLEKQQQVNNIYVDAKHHCLLRMLQSSRFFFRVCVWRFLSAWPTHCNTIQPSSNPHYHRFSTKYIMNISMDMAKRS